MVFPKYPDTFWSFKHALKFVSLKASNPPLGLLTIASMLPKEWEIKLIDMNVTSLTEKNIKWADYVFISAMSIQKKSALNIISECVKHETKVVVGGPLFTASHDEFKNVDHFVLNEAEITLPLFLKDLKNNCAKHMYSTNEFPNIKNIPPPRYDLLDKKKYSSMCIQYSRGCPFNCDFCDITVLYGRNVRTKSSQQIINELQNLYDQKWRGNIFIVDDNFIGNKSELKTEVLPNLINWMEENKYPFTFSTEVSINLSDDEELMNMMALAGFESVFVGIETPDENSLSECNKIQNKNRNMVECVNKIQSFGLQVTGGFIIGFDNDLPSIFKRQIDFIQKSGIISAMVGLLNAPRNTKLYHRLLKEKRLLRNISGDNTDFSMNFIPKMNYDILQKGYKEIICGIYSCKPYYERVMKSLKILKPSSVNSKPFHISYLIAFIRSIWHIGILESGRFYYWKLLFWCLFNKPSQFPLAVTYSIYGYHFRKVFAKYL